MSKVYLPTYTTSNCAVLLDQDTIRVYESSPTFDSYVNYTDYFINSHYLSKSGTDFITANTDTTCLLSSDITNNVFYRNDFDSIIVILFIILLICFYFPFKIMSRLFGRWLKL